MKSYSARIVTLACAAVLGFSCSVLLDSDRPQCRSVADCQERGASFEFSICEEGYCVATETGCESHTDCALGALCQEDRQCGEPASRWSCLEEVELDIRGAELAISVADYSRKPVPDAEIQLCWLLDQTCSEPSALATSDDDGRALVPLPDAFSGFALIQKEGYVPTLLMMPLSAREKDLAVEVNLAPTGIAEVFLEGIGTPYQSGRGFLRIAVRDCAGDLAADLRFSTPRQDAETVAYYVDDEQPVVTLEQTVGDYGEGGFLNLPAGPTPVEISLAETGQVMAELSTLVRGGHATLVLVSP